MKNNNLLLFFCVMLFINPAKIFSQSWVQKQNYPVTAGADGGVCFSISNKIYAGGGINSKLFKEYDPSTNQWTPKQNIPGVITDRSFGIGFSINGKGYVGLGLDGSTLKNDLWEYDPVGGGWTQKQNFPGLARDGLYCFVIDSIAYIGAGEDPFTTQQYNMAYTYNPISGWVQLPANYPTSGVIYPFSFSIGKKGFVSCGQTSSGATTNITYEYNSLNDQWTPKANYTGDSRQAGVSFVLGNKGYCGLGMDAGFYNDFYSYDTLTGTWSPADSLPAAGRSFPVAGVVNNTAYVGLGWSFATTETLYKDWWEFSLPTGLNDLENKNSAISIYPNPASQKISISLENKGQLTFIIVNTLGETIQSGFLQSTNNTIDVSAISSGIYFLHLQGENNNYTQLLMVRH